MFDDIPPAEMLKQNGFCVRGSWDAGIVEELRPDVGDGDDGREVVLEKYRNSAFAAGTRLESVLRGKGVRDVVVCGCATNVCVESTVRDGAGRDWR